jgi:hypothetical protein
MIQSGKKQQPENIIPEYASDLDQERNEENLRGHYGKDLGPIEWVALSKLFASGQVILISPGLDIVDAAVAMGLDQSEKVKNWIDQALLKKMPDELAAIWFEKETIVHALVVSPWVIVKEAGKD